MFIGDNMQLLQINNLRRPRYNVSISRITIKGNWEIKVDYELPSQGEERKQVRFSCAERPRAEFIKAFDEIKTNMSVICGLDVAVWEAGRVCSIGFKEKEEGTEVSIALRCVSPESVITAGVESLYPTGEFLAKIGNAIAEVEDYIDGVRQVQQMPLFAPIVDDEAAKELAGF
jgi:hypothetical protein